MVSFLCCLDTGEYRVLQSGYRGDKFSNKP